MHEKRLTLILVPILPLSGDTQAIWNTELFKNVQARKYEMINDARFHHGQKLKFVRSNNDVVISIENDKIDMITVSVEGDVSEDLWFSVWKNDVVIEKINSSFVVSVQPLEC